MGELGLPHDSGRFPIARLCRVPAGLGLRELIATKAKTLQHCTYCGEPADERDHTIPHSFLTNSVRGRPGGGGGLSVGDTVWACRECNRLLGSALLPSIQARATFVADKLERRYGKLLASPAWTDEELADVGPALRAQVLASAGQKSTIRRRIAFARGGL